MNKLVKTSFFILFLFTIYALTLGKKQLQSASMVPKDTLSTSQLSYFAVLSTGNTAGDTFIKINTAAGSAPSRTTNNLFVGDTLSIGVGSSMRTFTVSGIGNTAMLAIGGTTITRDVASSAVAIATRSATHVVSFTPQSVVTNGKWQVLIKATSTSGENFADGIPDQNGFDLSVGFTSTDVNCSALGAGSSAVASSIGTTAVVTTGNPNITNSYLVFECTTPSGVTSVGVGTSITIGGTHKLINPSPSSSHTEGTADFQNFLIRHLDGSGAVLDVDTVMGRIVAIESVRVTAQVDSTISFTIAGLGAGDRCGVPVNTAQQALVTSNQVPFGSLAIGSTLNTLAQQLSVITNGSSYVVTTFSPKEMTMIDGTGTTIPPTNCDTGGCTASSAVGWTAPDASNSEFGYSLESVSGSPTMAFTAGSNFTAKPFSSSPVTIFSLNSTPSVNQVANVCYRVAATTLQKTGDYEAQIVYTATATF